MFILKSQRYASYSPNPRLPGNRLHRVAHVSCRAHRAYHTQGQVSPEQLATSRVEMDMCARTHVHQQCLLFRFVCLRGRVRQCLGVCLPIYRQGLPLVLARSIWVEGDRYSNRCAHNWLCVGGSRHATVSIGWQICSQFCSLVRQVTHNFLTPSLNDTGATR